MFVVGVFVVCAALLAGGPGRLLCFTTIGALPNPAGSTGLVRHFVSNRNSQPLAAHSLSYPPVQPERKQVCTPCRILRIQPALSTSCITPYRALCAHPELGILRPSPFRNHDFCMAFRVLCTQTPFSAACIMAPHSSGCTTPGHTARPPYERRTLRTTLRTLGRPASSAAPTLFERSSCSGLGHSPDNDGHDPTNATNAPCRSSAAPCDDGSDESDKTSG